MKTISAMAGLALLLLGAAPAQPAPRALPEDSPENDQVWDRAVKAALEGQDGPGMDAIWSARVRQDGPTLARYRFDLFGIFRARPAFFVASASRHFRGNLDCAVDLLVPDTQVLEFHDVS